MLTLYPVWRLRLNKPWSFKKFQTLLSPYILLSMGTPKICFKPSPTTGPTEMSSQLSKIKDILSLTHNVSFRAQKLTHSVSFWAQKRNPYVSFWIQKTLKLANLCSNGFFLFLFNSYIIQSKFNFIFSFSIGQNS